MRGNKTFDCNWIKEYTQLIVTLGVISVWRVTMLHGVFGGKIFVDKRQGGDASRTACNANNFSMMVLVFNAKTVSMFLTSEEINQFGKG